MVNKLTKIEIYFLGLVFILVIAVTLNNKEDTAYFLWETFRIPDIALVINKDAELSFDIGNYYFNAEGSGVYNQEKAEKYFIKTLDLDSEHKFARHQLARIQFLRGDFGEALETINEQIEENGNSVISSYYVRGLIFGFVGELDKAERDFLHFISVKNENWGGYNDLAWIYFQKGDYKKTLEYANKGLSFAVPNPWLLTTKGIALMNLRKVEDSIVALELALELIQELQPYNWSQTNPGNDPRIAAEGLMGMEKIIKENLEIAVNKQYTRIDI